LDSLDSLPKYKQFVITKIIECMRNGLLTVSFDGTRQFLRQKVLT
jgi:hypothetical protein